MADTELKCLEGISGVTEVAERAVESRNYELLGRVLSTVEAKEKCKLNIRTCDKVLKMLTRSRGEQARSSQRVGLVAKAISGLSSSFEPDKDLYDRLLDAVSKFGLSPISSSIFGLFQDETRTKGCSLMTLLRRADFTLKVVAHDYNNSAFLEIVVNDIRAAKGRPIFNGPDINTTIIDAMIAQHGAHAMTTVVEATFSFLHNNRKSFNLMLDRVVLLQAMLTHQYNFIGACLAEFAADFSSVINPNSSYHSYEQDLIRNRQDAFVKAISFLIEYGSNEHLERLGKWAASEETLFTLVLETIGKSYVPDFLNMCLLFNSINPSGWRRYKSNDGTVIPSLHIRQVIKDYPDIIQKTDVDGRLTLHHAVDHSKTSVEAIQDIFEANPKGASIRDPVTGLYPFMVSASHGNVAASFILLLANPNLVSGGIAQTEGVNDKKRKRSSSLNDMNGID